MKATLLFLSLLLSACSLQFYPTDWDDTYYTRHYTYSSTPLWPLYQNPYYYFPYYGLYYPQERIVVKPYYYQQPQQGQISPRENHTRPNSLQPQTPRRGSRVN